MSDQIQGDDFPVVSPYKFILVNDQTGETVCDLVTEYVSDRDIEDSPDIWASDEAAHEALEVLGYSVKVVKK